MCVISCLVQLLIDPSTRTMEGYQSLIEREWVAMGHRFTDRCGLLTSETAEQVRTDVPERPLLSRHTQSFRVRKGLV